jgi:phosphoenolpyruvate-protein kinase (PTS system EI component)
VRGLLGHGTLLAREYGIPAVMGIPGATQRFRDDEVLELDGAAETIQKRW